jgi:hypothetical protein
MHEAWKMRKYKRLLRSKRTGDYMGENMQWVVARSHAKQWRDIPEIIEACNRYNLRDVEVVLDFGDPWAETAQIIEALAISMPGPDQHSLSA